jgi:hypothetical protein
MTAAAGTTRAELLQHLPLDLQPLVHWEPGVEQRGRHGDADQAEQFLSPRHLVHHQQHPAPLLG